MVRVGVIGTSNWTGRMYMQALQHHPDGAVTAVCARNPERTQAFAEKWGVPNVYTDWRDLLDSDEIDAVIVSTPNDTHFPMTMHALKNDIHVLCEKPLALNYAQADAMATEAERRALVSMTAFTHWHFPHYQYTAQLIRDGYVGTPFHYSWRYYAGLGLDGAALWRFDRRYGGEGALADIGSHSFAVARLFLGEVAAVSAQLYTSVVREDIPPEHRASDQGVINVKFTNGASGVIHISMVSHQPPREGIRQEFVLSGSNGTLYYDNDFSTQFRLRGAQLDDEAPTQLHVPDDIWHPNISRDNPRDHYADLFQKTDAMAREFVSAIAANRPINGPDLREGAEVQKLLDATVASHENDGAWVQIDV